MSMNISLYLHTGYCKAADIDSELEQMRGDDDLERQWIEVYELKLK